MCELLVYARVDGPDETLHPMRYRPGDVVVAKPDGCVWGTRELCAGSSFRVMVFPGVDVGEAEPLLSHQLSARDHNMEPTTVQRRRGFGLCVDHPDLPTGFSEWWAVADGTKFVLTAPSIADLKVPRRVMPIVLG
jgi:hypothetical protein